MTFLQSYLLTQNISANSPFVLAGIIAAGILFLATIVLRFLQPLLQKRYRLYSKYGQVVAALLPVLRISSLLWLLLFFLRFEDLSPFDRRIWVYALLIPTVVACLILARNKRGTIPVAEREDNLARRYKQYLPKPK